jgi:cytochrome c oxidase subunit 2
MQLPVDLILQACTERSQTLVNDAYLRDAILNPSQHVTAGFAPIMPTYQGQISEDGLIDLVEYIKTMQSNYRVQQTLMTSESDQAAPTTPTPGTTEMVKP